MSSSTASASPTAASASAGVTALRPWLRRVAIIFSPVASTRINDTEESAPGTRTAPLQSMSSRTRDPDDAIAHFVVVAAERAGKGHFAAEPGHGDRGIAG